jgi:hypothetical protein
MRVCRAPGKPVLDGGQIVCAVAAAPPFPGRAFPLRSTGSAGWSAV